MEKRNLIFIDHKGLTVCKTKHDTSCIQSLPRPGDDIYDTTQPTSIIPNRTISGIVQRIQFDYISGSVNIYIKID